MTTTLTENNPIRVFLDTNVIVDALTLRDTSYRPSQRIVRNIVAKNIRGYICSKQITDIYYIFRKYFKDEYEIRDKIITISELMEILPLFKGDILACLKTEMPDFEDAIIYEVAKVNMVNIIVTNNTNHFKRCEGMILTPEQFLDLYSLD
ncbi:MAG: PIN domain-containing protein [Bacilli bacterium]|nr:PIN domain-containing protein [Bacilli bacterium]